jgi:hypothetical protein
MRSSGYVEEALIEASPAITMGTYPSLVITLTLYSGPSRTSSRGSQQRHRSTDPALMVGLGVTAGDFTMGLAGPRYVRPFRE